MRRTRFLWTNYGSKHARWQPARGGNTWVELPRPEVLKARPVLPLRQTPPYPDYTGQKFL